MSRAAIYCRISDARDDDTAGVDRQEADCRQLAKRLKAKVTEVYIDNNVSAYRHPLADRPEGAQLVADISDGRIDVVLVYSVDRLYRRVAEIDSLIDQLGDRPVHSVSSGDVDLATADGRMLARMLATVSQHESEKRGERVARAARQRAERGGYGGGRRRFGYNDTATALVPEEAEAIRFAYTIIANGGTLESIVRNWRERFGTGSLGGTITGVQVRDILLRPLNAGIAVYKGKEVGRTAAPAIVDEDTYRSVVAILTDPARRTTRGRPAKSLLAPVLRCGICQGRMSSAMREHRSNSKAVPGSSKDKIYRCREGHTSKHREYLDAAVAALVGEYLVRNAERLRRPVTVKPDTASEEIATLRSRLDALAQLAANGDLDPVDYAAAARGVRDRLARLEEGVAKTAGTPASSALARSEDVATAWEAATVHEKRTIIREVVDHITITRGRPGPFTLDGVDVTWRDLQG